MNHKLLLKVGTQVVKSISQGQYIVKVIGCSNLRGSELDTLKNLIYDSN